MNKHMNLGPLLCSGCDSQAVIIVTAGEGGQFTQEVCLSDPGEVLIVLRSEALSGRGPIGRFPSGWCVNCCARQVPRF